MTGYAAMGLVTTGPVATVSAATVFVAFRSVGKDPSARLTSNWLCRHGIGGDCDGLRRDGLAAHAAMAHDSLAAMARRALRFRRWAWQLLAW